MSRLVTYETQSFLVVIGSFLYCEAIYIHCIGVLSVHIHVRVCGCCMVLLFWEVYPFVSGFDFLNLVPLIINSGGLGVPSYNIGGYLL